MVYDDGRPSIAPGIHHTSMHRHTSGMCSEAYVWLMAAVAMNVEASTAPYITMTAVKHRSRHANIAPEIK